MPSERAELLARLAGGRIDRARALDGRLAPVREAFVDATVALDGTGGAVAASAERLQDASKVAVADLEASQAAEIASLEAELDAAGYPERTRRAQLRRLDDHHKRVHRHARTEALIEGITALETVYRDALADPAPPAERRPPAAVRRRAGRRSGPRRLPCRPPGGHRAQPQREPDAGAPPPSPASRERVGRIPSKLTPAAL